MDMGMAMVTVTMKTLRKAKYLCASIDEKAC